MFAPLIAKPKSTTLPNTLVQPKLRIGRIDDPLEHEADRVADQVMRMPNAVVAVTAASSKIRRKCAECEEETLSRKEDGSRATAGEVPNIVHAALRARGQPLDPVTRAFFEPRFGFDFSRVRIHADAEAGDTATAIGARAYTAGTDVVFARGEFVPTTDEGRKLLAHELTHVVQQQSGALNNREPRLAGLAKGIGVSSAGRAIRRQPRDPKDDPNQTPHTVDAAGKLSPGTTKAGQVEGIWRIPIQGLQEDPKAWAVVLIPNLHVPTVSDVDVEVLLHFHGYGAGYRVLQAGETDYAGVLKPGQLRDIDLYEMEQQLLSLAKTEQRFIIAVLPQGSDRSGFGGVSKQSDAYVREVFARLIADGHLPKGTNPGNVTISGHSGGGVPASAAADQRVAHGGRQDLLLFDAINSGCVEKVQEEIKGEKQVNKDGTPKMTCIRCDSNEYRMVSKWVTDRIKSDAKIHVSQKNLKQFGTRFRGFTHAPVDVKQSTCSYGHWYALLKEDIDKAIAGLKADPDVAAQLHENFRVESVTGKHEDVMAHGSLEAALGD